MHRFSWDMHYDPLPGVAGGRGGAAAVPRRTYPAVTSPWVAPGSYTVRLTVNGQTQTQPIAIKLDPRVKVTPEVQQIFTLTTQAESNAANAAKVYKEARALLDKLKARPDSEALAKQLEEIAPAASSETPAPAGRGGRGGFGQAAPAARATLANIAALMVSTVMPMQGSELPPTAAQLKGVADQQAAYASLMAKWTALKAKAGAATSAP